MKTGIFLGVAIASCSGFLFFGGCGREGGDAVATTADSARSFTMIMTSKQYSGNLTRFEYRGKRVYEMYCLVCHGGDGDGRGFNAFNLKDSFGVQPADFTDSTFMANFPSETMMDVIDKGGRKAGKSQYMPPWGGTLSIDEIGSVVAYIKTISLSNRATELGR